MRRLLTTFCLLVSLSVLPAAAHADGAPLTYDQLRADRDALALRLATPRVAVPGHGAVRVTAFHAALVRQLGLGDVADHVRSVARRAGLHPPAQFGTEVIARALDLRVNHPFPRGEASELYPWQAIPRSEAAHSLRVIRRLSGWELETVRAAYGAFALPDLSDRARSALRVAVSRIGMPYVWGGETDGVSVGQVHGGYDCSGFVWRVFGAGAIGGRTADDQAHGIRQAQRVHAGAIRPADLLFFGRRGYADHVGIAMGDGWMIHSSSQGVAVVPLATRDRGFLWGRRVV
jgi:cell wall-associated NlpC family hydrolase